MVKIYVRCIIRGDITLNDVPKRWKENTRLELIKQGYEINEDGTVTYVGVA